MAEKTVIPSRAEHDALVRKIWKLCLIGAVLLFATTGTTVLVMWKLGYDSKAIVNVSTIVFQVVLLPYGLGYVAPTLATSLLKMALGVEMSRRGLEIADSTAGTLEKLNRDVTPVVADVKELVSDLKPMIAEFRKQDSAKIHGVLERMEKELNGGGKLDRLVVALEKIAKKTDQKADDVLGDMLAEAWAPEQPKDDSSGPPEGT